MRYVKGCVSVPVYGVRRGVGRAAGILLGRLSMRQEGGSKGGDRVYVVVREGG